jgi:hypothetical protein
MWPFKKRSETPRVPPEPTSAMHAEAARNPNGWVYVLDGNFGPNDAVPPQKIVGAWKVDGSGKLTGEYKANHNYVRNDS